MSTPRDTPTPVEIEPPDSVVLAISNAPDTQTAQTLARALVTERLAACVNVLAPCASIYRWQGAIEEASEVPMLIKTTRRR
jgi:periplasmic divalent cation tolerance protein